MQYITQKELGVMKLFLNLFSQYPTAVPKRNRPLSPKSLKHYEAKYWDLKPKCYKNFREPTNTLEILSVKGTHPL